MKSAESWLKLVLHLFGWTSVLAFFPFVMPWSWMAIIHEWLGMGPLPHQPVVEYLARSTSGLCGLYGGLLLVLARDVRRYSSAIAYSAATIIVVSGIGAVFGLRAGMPAWWMVADVAACWLLCGGMLIFVQRLDSR